MLFLEIYKFHFLLTFDLATTFYVSLWTHLVLCIYSYKLFPRFQSHNHSYNVRRNLKSSEFQDIWSKFLRLQTFFRGAVACPSTQLQSDGPETLLFGFCWAH